LLGGVSDTTVGSVANIACGAASTEVMLWNPRRKKQSPASETLRNVIHPGIQLQRHMKDGESRQVEKTMQIGNDFVDNKGSLKQVWSFKGPIAHCSFQACKTVIPHNTHKTYLQKMNEHNKSVTHMVIQWISLSGYHHRAKPRQTPND